MRNIILFITTTLLLSCAASSPYSWQDTRQPVREDATADLEKCRTYAAKQYQPGTPMGESYLKSQEVLKDHEGFNNQAGLKDQAGGQAVSNMEDMDNDSNGQWRPDRSPFPIININDLPIHEVPVDYTGYPGELDYYPSYLDDILEKCMHDHGWGYLPVAGDQQEADEPRKL